MRRLILLSSEDDALLVLFEAECNGDGACEPEVVEVCDPLDATCAGDGATDASEVSSIGCVLILDESGEAGTVSSICNVLSVLLQP
jgi:hypothetical protein